MKKILLLVAIAVQAINIKAQITFEHSYLTSQNTVTEEFFLTNLGGNNYKYVIYTPDSSRFSLYNLDHSPFLLNIAIPLSISLTGGPYRLGYITTSLFDCDSTSIEYAMMLNSPLSGVHPNFAVYRIDGTQLFAKDTVGTVFCVGCGSGSYEMHPIMNTPAGAKLFLYDYNTPGYTNYLVYSLCGEMPEAITEISQSNAYVNIYPNPSSGQTTFKISTPSHSEKYELAIFNTSLQLIKSVEVSGGESEMLLDNKLLNSGMYFYSLQNKSKIFQTGKFILSQ